jgi:hypothetical protein
LSLHTDSETEAQRKAAAAWDTMLRSWEAKLRGDTTDAVARYEAAVNLARTYGFSYVPAIKVADRPLPEIIDRVDAAHTAKGRVDMPAARALLGAVDKPRITVTGALKLYWQIAADKTLGKSEDQIRRWKNPRIKAVNNFVDVVGDVALEDLTPDDMQDFRDWWIERIRGEGLTPNSGNKDIVHLTAMLRAVDKTKRLRLDLPLSGWAIQEGEKRTRTGFSTKWIKERLLAPGALAGLNAQAQGVVLAMVNTGARPSELTCLTDAQIRLNVDIPHISIEPVGRDRRGRIVGRGFDRKSAGDDGEVESLEGDRPVAART